MTHRLNKDVQQVKIVELTVDEFIIVTIIKLIQVIIVAESDK